MTRKVHPRTHQRAVAAAGVVTEIPIQRALALEILCYR